MSKKAKAIGSDHEMRGTKQIKKNMSRNPSYFRVEISKNNSDGGYKKVRMDVSDKSVSLVYISSMVTTSNRISPTSLNISNFKVKAINEVKEPTRKEGQKFDLSKQIVYTTENKQRNFLFSGI